MSSSRKGYPIALIATTFLATTAIFIGYLTRTQHLPALVLALWRDILMTLLLFPALFIIQRGLPRLGRGNVRFFVAFGLAVSLFNAAWAFSVLLNGAAVATVLAYGSVAFTALLGRWIFGERLTLAKILAIGLSLGGIVLVARAYDAAVWQMNPLGIVSGVGVALLYAVYNLMGKETAHRGISSWTALLYSFSIAALYLLVFNLIPGLPGGAGSLKGLLPAVSMEGWLALLGLAAVSVIGYGLYVLSMKYLQASIANLIATLEPVITALLAYVLLGERLLSVQLVGAVLIVMGLVIVRYSEDRA